MANSKWISDIERQVHSEGYSLIAGIDEAGRGPLAGPVVSAAVILPDDFTIKGLTDSKRLSPRRREEIFWVILEYARAVSIGWVSSWMVDRINIRRATLLSMEMALHRLKIKPDYVLIDGKDCFKSEIPAKAVVKGDLLCPSISAASIIAKVMRDRLMIFLDRLHPNYGFARHKGYGTALHKRALIEFGLTSVHRRSFCRFLNPTLS